MILKAVVFLIGISKGVTMVESLLLTCKGSVIACSAVFTVGLVY